MMSPVQKIQTIMRSNDCVLSIKTLNEINDDYMENIADDMERSFIATSMFFRGMHDRMEKLNLTFEDAKLFLYQANVSMILMTTNIDGCGEFIDSLGKRDLVTTDITLNETDIDICRLIIENMIIMIMSDRQIGSYHVMTSMIASLFDTNPKLKDTIASIEIPDGIHYKFNDNTVAVLKEFQSLDNFSDQLDIYCLTTTG